MSGVVLANASLDLAFHDTYHENFCFSQYYMCNFSTRARYSRASQKVPSVGASLTRRVREEILFSHWNFSPPAKHCFASQAKNDNYLNEKDNNPFYLKDNKSNPEYVRYVEQFFVGLLEGDGSITSSLRTKGKKIESLFK